MFSLSVKSLRIRNNFCAFALIAAVLMVSAVSASAKELIVYTALENEQINKYLASFKEQNKDVDVKIVRDSTGIITAKLLAEGAKTPADVEWATASSSLLVIENILLI